MFDGFLRKNRDSVVEPQQVVETSAQRIDRMVRTHLEGVWRLARRYGLSNADAEDVTQRTMMIASRRIAEIQPDRERSFLYSTVLFLTRSVRRDWRRHPHESLPDQYELFDPRANPEDLVDQHRARARLDSLLSQIPEELRVVFILFEFESLSQGEIAAMLGIPKGTVASRLHRARQCFTTLLAERERAFNVKRAMR
jgi:RNA polymerase sigma-70 factor, ECF subfamily